ncbi:MAG: hypothetical protein JNJ63_06370 [Hyphomonadaceae bacterium]|nr:hypothetical protein [Hyphomonadaceae bacterium]
MGQQSIAGIAALVALAFVIMALSACAGPAQVTQTEPIMVAAVAEPEGVPEFHGARIGGDTLRSRLETE